MSSIANIVSVNILMGLLMGIERLIVLVKLHSEVPDTMSSGVSRPGLVCRVHRIPKKVYYLPNKKSTISSTA